MCATCTIDHAKVITSISFRNGHKAPPKSLGHLRLREQRRQPLQKFSQKAPQSPALKPPSTARTAGRSDRAKRRFRRQPFILLSFSSSEKLRKAQETQSYQRFQHIVHTVFNTSGTNAATFVSRDCGGYTLAFANGIAHSGSQGETGAFRTGPLSLPSTRTARSRTSPGRVSERRTLPLLGLGHGCSQRPQRAFGTAMRLCASLSRRRRGPAGLRDLFRFCRNRDLYIRRSWFSACARQGRYHYPRCAPRAAETLGGRLSKRLICRFLRSGGRRSLRDTSCLSNQMVSLFIVCRAPFS